jgi:hypothetical protein
VKKFRLIHGGIYTDCYKEFIGSIVYGTHWQNDSWHLYTSPSCSKHICNAQYDDSHQIVEVGDEDSIPYKDCIYDNKVYKYLTYKFHPHNKAILFDINTLEYVNDVNINKISCDVTDIDWSKSHCGVILADYTNTSRLMPEVIPIINDLVDSDQLQYDISEYLIDVKVHMLMPDQYPCIPNWHCDFVPRDSEMALEPDKVTGDKMYLWVSNGPYTEFKSPPSIIKGKQTKWVEFDQTEIHRGRVSEEHTWRAFIRLVPKKFTIGRGIKNMGEIRRHAQVYLDAAKFTW